MNIDGACPKLQPPGSCDRLTLPATASSGACPSSLARGGRDLIDAWTRLAFTHREDGRLDDAELAARTVLRHAPDTAEARHVLGMVHHDRNRLSEAEDSFRGAIRLNPDAPAAWINLGLVRQKLGDLAEAEACYRVAHRLGASIAAVGGNLGLVLLEQGRVEEAELACRMALAQRPDDAGARLNLAMILLLTGRYAEGWAAYEARIAVDPWPSPAPNPAALALGNLTEARGRVVLVRGEQGFGDVLQFCRYAPLLTAAGARVILEVPPPLVGLLRTLPDVAEVIPTGSDPGWFDRHCRLLSLPFLFGTTLDTIPAEVPYLHADPARAESWRQRLGHLSGRRVGILWAGGSRIDNPHAAAIDRRRSIPLPALAPLERVTGCAFVSLRAGEAAPDWMHDAMAGVTDFAETAAIIAALDLVIAVDTAVAHLAGALGKPVWLLNRHDTCWRWLRGRDDSPWYPTLRQFRQETAGDWDGVIARVAAALAEPGP